jgi:hypothetical protein
VDTRVVYRGDTLDQLKKLPEEVATTEVGLLDAAAAGYELALQEVLRR